MRAIVLEDVAVRGHAQAGAVDRQRALAQRVATVAWLSVGTFVALPTLWALWTTWA